MIMKKLTLLTVLLCLAIITQAQFGVLGGVASGVISQRQRAQLKKHLFVNLNMTLPISLSNSLSGAKLVMPPTYVSAEYGIYDNITLGGMIGTMTTESSGSIQSLANDIATGNLDINTISFQSVLDNLISGTNPVGSNSNYSVRATSTLIGGSIKYNFVGGKKSNLFIANRTGIKIKNVKEDYGDTGNELVDQVVNVAESTAGFFSSFSFGGNFFLDKENKWAVSPEIGWGPGWGDGFSITGNPFLITIGATYHRKPKKPVVPKLK